MNVMDLASGLLYFAVFAGLGCLALRATRNHQGTLAFQTQLFLWAIVARFAVSLLLYQAGLINVIKEEDGSGWVVGQVWAQNWKEQGYSALDAPFLFLRCYGDFQRGYYYLLAALFLGTGLPGRLPAAALDCLCGSFTVVLAYRVARTLFSEKVARLAGWLTCLYPSLIFWSAQTLKEPVVIFLEMLVIYGCLRLRQSGFTLRQMLLVAIVSALLFPFRFYAAYIAGATALITLVLPRYGQGKSPLAAGLVLGAVVLVLFALLGNQLPKEVQMQRLDVDYIAMLKHGSALGQNSGVKIDADLHTTTGMGYAILVGALYLLLAPFPWQWGASLRMTLVVPEVVLWWGLLAYAVVPGLRHGVRNRYQDILPLLMFLGGMGLLYSLTFGNVGLIYRQRAQLMPLLLIFAAVGIELRRFARTRARPNTGEAAGPPGHSPGDRDAELRARTPS